MTRGGFGWPGAEGSGRAGLRRTTQVSGQGAAPDGTPVRQPLERSPADACPGIRWAPTTLRYQLPCAQVAQRLQGKVAGGLSTAEQAGTGAECI